MRVFALANLYRADHAAQMAAYRPSNPVASSWNSALFAELSKLDLDLDVVQFLPIRRAHRLQEGRTTYHYLPRVPRVDNFTSLLKRARISSLLDEFKPDVVHGIGSEHGHVWPVVRRGMPSVITIHGYLRVINSLAGHNSWLKRKFLVREERLALLQADRVLAVNGYMRDKLVADGVDEQRIAVVPNALNPLFLEPAPQQVRDIDVVMVGTIHPLKNVHIALEFFEGLARAFDVHPRVVVVGAASVESRHYFEALLAQREKSGLANVTFVGKLDAVELRSYYRRARFLLHISAFETDSMVLTEAMASGAVPIVNPVAALSTRVADKVTGHYLPVSDIDAAPASLYRILTNEPQREIMANANLRMVSARYSARQVAVATAAEYERLASYQRSRSRSDPVAGV